MLSLTAAAAALVMAVWATKTLKRVPAGKGPCANCADSQRDCDQCALDQCSWYAW